MDSLLFLRRFPRVFPRVSPQTVENSVDSFAKMWKKPHKSRLFRGFNQVKSSFGVVGKCHSVLFFVENNFLQGKLKNLWKSHKLTKQSHKKKRAGNAVLFGSVCVFYNVQINRSITPYPSVADRLSARSAAWQAVTAPRSRAASVLRACLR